MLDKWVDTLMKVRKNDKHRGSWVLVNLVNGGEIGVFGSRDEAIRRAISMGPGLYGLVYVPLPGEE